MDILIIQNAKDEAGLLKWFAEKAGHTCQTLYLEQYIIPGFVSQDEYHEPVYDRCMIASSIWDALQKFQEKVLVVLPNNWTRSGVMERLDGRLRYTDSSKLLGCLSTFDPKPNVNFILLCHNLPVNLNHFPDHHWTKPVAVMTPNGFRFNLDSLES